jgi:hypothetical protein
MSLEYRNFKSFLDTKVLSDLEEIKKKMNNHFVDCSTLNENFQTVIEDGITSSNDIQYKALKLIELIPDNVEKGRAVNYLRKMIEESIKNVDSIFKRRSHNCDLKNFVKNHTVSHSNIRNKIFEYVIKGNVNITRIKNNISSHKIRIDIIDKILAYQVYDKNDKTTQIIYMPKHPDVEDHPKSVSDSKEYIKNNPDKIAIIDYKHNKNRSVYLQTAREWINDFNSIENFKPTTVMEIDYKKYIFVINKVNVTKNNKLVLYISTKEIKFVGKVKYSNSVIKKIPTGIYKNVRFDIDDVEVYGNSIGCHPFKQSVSENMSNMECFCPKDSKVTTIHTSFDITYIDYCRDYCRSDHPYLTAGLCYSGCNRGENDYPVGVFCWTHNYVNIFGKYLDFPYAAGYGKDGYAPRSFVWGNSEGYICWNRSQTDLRYCVKCDASTDIYPTNYCTVKTGNYCCPNGASCPPIPPPPFPKLYFCYKDNKSIPYNEISVVIFNKTATYNLQDFTYTDRNIPIIYEISDMNSKTKAIITDNTTLTINIEGGGGFCIVTATQGGSDSCVYGIDSFESFCLLRSSVKFEWVETLSVKEICNNYYPTDDDAYYRCLEAYG